MQIAWNDFIDANKYFVKHQQEPTWKKVEWGWVDSRQTASWRLETRPKSVAQTPSCHLKRHMFQFSAITLKNAVFTHPCLLWKSSLTWGWWDSRSQLLLTTQPSLQHPSCLQHSSCHWLRRNSFWGWWSFGSWKVMLVSYAIHLAWRLGVTPKWLN